jgi:prepilin-type N-terminal cleavage/methylation domain-containing protein
MMDYKKILKIYKNEQGFTLVELLVASAVSVVLLSVLAKVITHQGNSFAVQNELNQMQTNGRATTEFISRAVQNAGYNVFRGTRFLAASDHYITAVYDANNDAIIQNDEVMTFAPGNNNGGTGETFNIKPFFDRNEDGEVEGTETAVFPITMNLASLPYDMYKVIPNKTGTGVTHHLMARNIDNLIIRYYDKNNNPLPSGVAVDVVNGVPIPRPPFNFAANPSELNDIRRVDIEVVARTQKPNPKGIDFPQGDYVTGSVATVAGGNTFEDAFYRETFTANQAPRNLVMAPWGKMDVVASPISVNCPDNTSTVTATLVDETGDPASSGVSIDFAASSGATMNPTTSFTNSFGEAISTVSYGWSKPNESVTVSASSLIAANGKQYPVFSAGTTNFQSGNGTFADLFEGGFDPNWVELDNPGDINEVDTAPVDGTNDTLEMTSTTGLMRAVNGCSWQKYQVEFELTPNGDIDRAFTPAMVGGFLRYESQSSNYSTVVEKTGGNCLPGDGLPYCLKIIYWDGVFPLTLGTLGANLDFINDVKYKMVAQAEDDNLRVKIWNANLPGDAIPGLGLADPNPGNWDYTDGTFPGVYRFEVTDTTITNGQIGLIGDWTNGATVVFDNFNVTPIN